MILSRTGIHTSYKDIANYLNSKGNNHPSIESNIRKILKDLIDRKMIKSVKIGRKVFYTLTPIYGYKYHRACVVLTELI